MKKIRKKWFEENKNTCEFSCSSLISDGFGRWINDSWKPFSQGMLRRSSETGTF